MDPSLIGALSVIVLCEIDNVFIASKPRINAVQPVKIVVLLLLGLGTLLNDIYADDRDNTFPVNELLSNNSTMQTATFNAMYAYPLSLRSVKCFPSDFMLCINDSTRRAQACCKNLFDEGIVEPDDIVDNTAQYVVCFLPTIIILSARAFLIWFFSLKKKSNTKFSSHLVCFTYD
jgi:hypothetical protein